MRTALHRTQPRHARKGTAIDGAFYGCLLSIPLWFLLVWAVTKLF